MADPLDDALVYCHAVMSQRPVADTYTHSTPVPDAVVTHAYTNDPAVSPWPEPYDSAGDSDTGSLNAGLDRLGDHGACPGGFGSVDRAQRVDRARRDVPPRSGEPVRDSDREAADAMTREAQERGEYEIDLTMPVYVPSERKVRVKLVKTEPLAPLPFVDDSEPLSSIPGLIDQIRRERDEWKARAEAAERKLAERAQCAPQEQK